MDAEVPEAWFAENLYVMVQMDQSFCMYNLFICERECGEICESRGV